MLAIRSFARTFAASAALMLAACATDNVVDLTAPSFDQMPAYHMNVAEIRVLDQFEPPFEGNHVEHLFPTSPARGVGIWANDRLDAAGTQGVMEVVIKDASVVETHGKDFDRFDAALEVDLKLYDGRSPLAVSEANSRVTLSRSIKSTASITKREDMFAQMTRDLLASLNQSLEANLNQYFRRHTLSVGR